MITTFDNKQWNYIDIIKRMYDDDFYYGYLGSNALSSSSAKKLLQSPKAYLKSLNINSNAQPLRDGRLVHLSVLEPPLAPTNLVLVLSAIYSSIKRLNYQLLLMHAIDNMTSILLSTLDPGYHNHAAL